MTSPAAVVELGHALAELGWISDLFVAGSLATGDYVAGVSDLDLVALADGPVDPARLATLTALHRRLDEGIAAGLQLGCVYVDAARRQDVAAKHPTWTHGVLVQRSLSLATRAELVRHGYAVFGRPTRDTFAAMSADDIRAAARAELTGYWAWAARRPWLWLHPIMADLGLTSMARGRHALATGELLTKSDAIERIDAPAWLIDQVRARRRGATATSPRVRTALIAWRDARRTTSRAAETIWYRQIRPEIEEHEYAWNPAGHPDRRWHVRRVRRPARGGRPASRRPVLPGRHRGTEPALRHGRPDRR